MVNLELSLMSQGYRNRNRSPERWDCVVLVGSTLKLNEGYVCKRDWCVPGFGGWVISWWLRMNLFPWLLQKP